MKRRCLLVVLIGFAAPAFAASRPLIVPSGADLAAGGALIPAVQRLDASLAPSVMPLILQKAPEGAPEGWKGEYRCAPTSLAMIARTYGLKPKLNDAQLVDLIDKRDKMTNRPTSLTGIANAARFLTLDSVGSRSFINEEEMARVFDAGGYILVQGDPANLLSLYQHGPDHTVALARRVASGYEVHDPLVRTPYSVSSGQLLNFANGGGHVYVGPSGRLQALAKAVGFYYPGN